MADEKFYVTEEGLVDLQNELQTLIHVTREEVKEDLRAARAQGDLSENADYDAARDRQAQVEARIKELEWMINHAEIIKDNQGGGIVRVGSKVEIKELDINETNVYTIVGTIEADPLNGRLSNVTPLAEAILDQRVGSVCEVKVEHPYKVKILSVR